MTAVYAGIFAGLALVTGWLFVRGGRRRWVALALSLAAAAALALLIYYGQYIGRIIGDTLPTFGQAIETSGEPDDAAPYCLGLLDRSSRTRTAIVPPGAGICAWPGGYVVGLQKTWRPGAEQHRRLTPRGT